MLRASHEQIGHQGVNKTSEYLSRVYWFLNLKRRVQEFNSNCIKCITYNTISNRIEGKLHYPVKGNLPFKCLHLDHYGSFEKTNHRQKYIFEIIDGFT